MLTKAQKLRAKRKAQLGRPRKANAERFACGKIKPEWSKLPIPMKPPLCSEMIAPPVSGMISPPV
ncbi:hypothetical protein CN083_17340 [Sinorhizobium meliloti]|nr:hypothetical protein CN188_22505 [Sinorhizobium meliloti]RVJ00515.1 hypothetical protein CN193_18130 [Sinorhizobium meliloti]RVP07095.1 hypothetical protein CN083_17340 [Sinorhizobium meliloti]